MKMDEDIEEYVDMEAFKKDKSRAYVPKTHKERIYEYLKKTPIISLPALYAEFPQINESTIRVHVSLYRRIYQAAYMKEDIKRIYELLVHHTTLNKKLNKEEKISIKKVERWLYK